MPRALVIEDNEAARRLLQELLPLEGWEVSVAPDGAAGLELARRLAHDLVILDLRMPGMDGLEVLIHLRQVEPDLPVIILTADRDVQSAVLATKRGAFDYLTKPLDAEQLLLTCRRALEMRLLRLELEDLRNSGSNLLAQMGGSPAITSLLEQVRRLAPTEQTVLVTGETGSGKELVAQALHRKSERRARPLVAIDCGRASESLLGTQLFATQEAASTRPGDAQLIRGGSLLLDEVGNLTRVLQARLQASLERRDATASPGAALLELRLIATTHCDLPALAREGRFRSDLYERLAQQVLHVPALRERPADIPYLAQRFLEEASVELRRPTLSIAADALQVLSSYSWPGNVRELRNVVRQAVLDSNDPTLRGAAVARQLVLVDAKTAP